MAVKTIKITKNGGYWQYIPEPLVAGDVQAYRLVLPTDGFGNAERIKVSALRADGVTITDSAPVSGGTAMYTLRNSMYAIEGDVRVRVTLLGGDRTALTAAELSFQVLAAEDENGIAAEDRYPVLTKLLIDTQTAVNSANEAGGAARAAAKSASEASGEAKTSAREADKAAASANSAAEAANEAATKIDEMEIAKSITDAQEAAAEAREAMAGAVTKTEAYGCREEIYEVRVNAGNAPVKLPLIYYPSRPSESVTSAEVDFGECITGTSSNIDGISGTAHVGNSEYNWNIPITIYAEVTLPKYDADGNMSEPASLKLISSCDISDEELQELKSNDENLVKDGKWRFYVCSYHSEVSEVIDEPYYADFWRNDSDCEESFSHTERIINGLGALDTKNKNSLIDAVNEVNRNENSLRQLTFGDEHDYYIYFKEKPRMYFDGDQQYYGDYVTVSLDKDIQIEYRGLRYNKVSLKNNIFTIPVNDDRYFVLNYTAGAKEAEIYVSDTLVPESISRNEITITLYECTDIQLDFIVDSTSPTGERYEIIDEYGGLHQPFYDVPEYTIIHLLDEKGWECIYKQEITAADLADEFGINTSLLDVVSHAYEKIDTEKADREAGDDKLTQKINDEATARTNAVAGVASSLGMVNDALAEKVDKIAGKGLSENDYTTTEKAKLEGIEENANNYTHPASHPAAMIEENAERKFITSAEKTKLAGIATGANKYIHPASHPASMITTDSERRFVTDAEKTAWNALCSDNPAGAVLEELQRHENETPASENGAHGVRAVDGKIEIFDGQNYIEMQKAYKTYGVSIDLENSDPASAVTYTDSAVGMTAGSDEWDSANIFRGIRPCLFKDGAVVGYLAPNNFAKYADGTDADIISGDAGDVMIEIPKLGVKIATSGSTLTVQVTDDPNAEGFQYYAHTREKDGDREKVYIGAFLGYELSSKLRSLSGKQPTASVTIGQARTLAQANGGGYDQIAFYQLTLIQCLFLIKYKSRNAQIAFGYGCIMGNKVIKTGGTITKGMNFGGLGDRQMKFLGIEDFWGNLYYWIDGIVSSSDYHALTATQNFNDEGAGYDDKGQIVTAKTGGFMKTPQGTNDLGFIIKTSGASATTYFSDGSYFYSGCVADFGGCWNASHYAGVFRLALNKDSSQLDDIYGARLMYL